MFFHHGAFLDDFPFFRRLDDFERQIFFRIQNFKIIVFQFQVAKVVTDNYSYMLIRVYGFTSLMEFRRLELLTPTLQCGALAN